jgi:hypothetical protein
MVEFLWGLWNGITAWPLLIIHVFHGLEQYPIYNCARDTGWYQFGYRFAIDFLPFLFLLLLVDGRPFGRPFYALGAAGAVVCTWGALVFGRG